MKLPKFISEWLINKAKKNPYLHLDGYMNRFHLIAPNSFIGKLFTARIIEGLFTLKPCTRYLRKDCSQGAARKQGLLPCDEPQRWMRFALRSGGTCGRSAVFRAPCLE